MMLVRRADERGGGDHGWLRTRHTFSFADYYGPRWMRFRTLRVRNEDVVEPGRGCPRHSRRDAHRRPLRALSRHDVDRTIEDRT